MARKDHRPICGKQPTDLAKVNRRPLSCQSTADLERENQRPLHRQPESGLTEIFSNIQAVKLSSVGSTA